mgnify:CR=1 FL=1
MSDDRHKVIACSRDDGRFIITCHFLTNYDGNINCSILPLGNEEETNINSDACFGIHYNSPLSIGYIFKKREDRKINLSSWENEKYYSNRKSSQSKTVL